jgi:hypothetical protein
MKELVGFQTTLQRKVFATIRARILLSSVYSLMSFQSGAFFLMLLQIKLQRKKMSTVAALVRELIMLGLEVLSH